MQKSHIKTVLQVIFIFAAAGLFAMGRTDDTEPQEVSGLENWDHSMDISELSPGEYNIIVRGTDMAGNLGVGGPYNIFIDPSIQIPSVSISTPAEGSRVGNVVHVVGTAADDEKVDRVEIAVDDGAFRPVDGTVFWSTSLDCTSWEDGSHSLKVRALDEDRNESPVAVVSFFKDTVKPVIDVYSHENGSYISGKIELKGSITDFNGISYSVFSEDGEEQNELKLSKTKEEGRWEFSRKIDTREYEDGAHVYWIEAVDGLGSKSRQSFLYYVDNSAPELNLLSPEPEESVNGLITLIGTADDSVGLAGLSYEADNGTGGEISLSPGNPVWVLPLDYAGFNGKEAKVKLDLTDIVGNHANAVYKIPLDHEADLPVPGLAENSPADQYRGIPVLTGMIIDDDGHDGMIEYSLNKGEWAGFEVSGPWSLSLDDAVFGVNSLEIRAVDRYGRTGLPVKLEIRRSQPEPAVTFEMFYQNEESTEWFPGGVLDAGNPGILSGRFTGSESITKLSLSINGEEAGQLTLRPVEDSGEKTFDIKLPKNLESGRMDISVSGVDESGNGFRGDTVYYNYLKPETEEGQPVPEYRIVETGGINLIYPQKKISAFYMLDNGLYISGWIPEGEIKHAELSGGSHFLAVAVAGRGFRISAKAEGRAEGVTLTLKLKNGDEIVSKPMDIASDLTPPKIVVADIVHGMIVHDEFDISISSEDNTGGSKVFYSVDGGQAFRELDRAAAGEADSAAEFTGRVVLSGDKERLIDFVVKAEDSFGNQRRLNLPLLRDTAAPEIDFITSVFERGAEQITYSGHISDGNVVESLKASFLPPIIEAVEPAEGEDVSSGPQVSEAREYNAGINGNVFYLDVNLTELGFEPGDVVFTASDTAENRVEIKQNPGIDLSEGKPMVSIQVPAEGDSFETGFSLSGLILDKEGVSSVYYSLNDGEYIEGGTGNLFTIPLSLGQLNDDRNTVSVKAVDLNGLESEAVSRDFLISHEPPEIEVDYPHLDAVVRDTVVLKGKASDINGIKNIFVSHDNGNTFQKADGREDWSYVFDTKLLKSGVSSILVKAEDMAGVSGFFTTLINIDNEVPEIILSHPADGEEVRGVLSVSGRALDNSGIKSLKVFVSPLDDSEDFPSEEIVLELESRGTILETVELGSLIPGSYSFRAEAVDAAENISTVSRVVRVLSEELRPPVLLAPLPGESLGPVFSIQGVLPDYFPKVLIMIDGQAFKTVDVAENGYFRYNVSAEDSFPEGSHVLTVRAEISDQVLESEGTAVEYHKEGLWTVFNNISHDQYVSDRFVVEGSAGYNADIDDPKQLKELQPKKIRLSLDGGKTFNQIRITDGTWSYTLYKEEIPDGELYLLARTFSGDEEAAARCRIIMDTEEPELHLFSPDENSKQYGSLTLSGEASDENGLTNVSLSLREGDKDNYETPSFIQGMYFDATGLGATYFTAGFGLTFMDGNVKLQAQYGYAPTTIVDPDTGLERSARFGGNVIGAKLLANLAQIPFSWLFGPELSAFSATAALGANFSYFSNNTVDAADSWGVILAGVIGQAELPKITFEDRKFLKYVSVFWEGQLWLISSDVSPEVILLPSVGVRLGLF